MLTLITSPMCAYRRLLPPSTLMHITRRAPVLSATSSIVCIWIIATLQLNPPGDASRIARVLRQLRRPVLEPVRVEPPGAGATRVTLPRRGIQNYGRIYAYPQLHRAINDLDDLCLLDQAFYPPGLGLGELAAGLDLDQVALFVFVVLVVRVILPRPGDHLAVERVLDPALDENRHRLVHLVADDASDLGLDQAALAGACGGGRRRIEWFVHACPAFWLSSVLTRAMSRRTRTTLALFVSCCVAFCMRRPNCSLSSACSSVRSSSGDLSRRSLLRSDCFMLRSSYP